MLVSLALVFDMDACIIEDHYYWPPMLYDLTFGSYFDDSVDPAGLPCSLHTLTLAGAS